MATQDYQDSVFSRVHPSCRFGSQDSLAIAPLPSTLPWIDWCSPSFHRHDYINQKARTLFLSRLISLSLLFLLPSPPPPLFFFASTGKVRWRGCALSNRVDDRRERIKYRTGRAFDCRLRREGWKRTNGARGTPSSLSIDETRLSFHSPSPIMHPSPLVLRVLFGSERVQGVPASDSLVGGGCNFSVYARACRNCFVPIRILDSQFYSLNSTKTFGQMIYD